MTELPLLCKECSGKCCTNPYLSSVEYIRLVQAIGNDAAQEAEPVHIAGGWMFRGRVCPGLTPTGCILPYADRPMVCRIYPFVPAQVIGKDCRITTIPLLRVSTCPAWREFGAFENEARMEIENDGKN